MAAVATRVENDPLRQAHRDRQDWRRRYPGRFVERPTYSSDLVGGLDPLDERHNILAWLDVPAGDPKHDSYYATAPDFRPFGGDLRSRPALGSGAGPWDAAMYRAMYGTVTLLGEPPTVQGEGYNGETARPVPGAPTALDPREATEKVKWFARYLGAGLVGIGPLNPAFVYTNVGRTFFGQPWGEPIGLSHPNAVIVAVTMHLDNLKAPAGEFPHMLETAFGYSKVSHIAVQLAMLISGMGYSVRAHHPRNYQVLPIPVAVDAGLGELGRCGYLVNPELGSNLRLAAVTTDMPLIHDSSIDFGLQEFCSRCRACVKACPAGAIPSGDKVAVRGVRKWKLDEDKCYRHFYEVDNHCVACMVACPWTRGR